MPNRHAIQTEILTLKQAGQDKVRRRYLAALAKLTGRDTIVYASDSFSGRSAGQPAVRYQITMEDVQGFMAALHGLNNDSLDIILHSGGGSLQAAELIVHYLRDKYQHIRAIVPMAAMSAATMIACACDEIVMARHSCIGPTDPQISLPTQNGTFTAAAFSILAEFSRAQQDVRNQPNTAVLWGAKLKDYPPGLLNICEQVTALAKIKVQEWLARYMFKEDPDRDVLATEIASWLGNAQEHLSHGRPITYNVAREHGLKIRLLEDDPDLQEKVLSLFHSIVGTFEVTTCAKFVENHKGKGMFTTIMPTLGPQPA
jgi:hypothetical protein